MTDGAGKKVARITGAVMGIGMAVTERLAKDGLSVIVSDLDEAKAGDTAAELRGRGLSAEPLGSTCRSPNPSRPPLQRSRIVTGDAAWS